MSSTSRKLLCAVVLAVALAVWGAIPSSSVSSTSVPTPSAPTAPSEPRTSAGGHTSEVAGSLEELLGKVALVGNNAQVPGYDRACGPDAGCVFGPAWTDDNDGPSGHDGCDTRNNVLQRDLSAIEYRPGTHDCVVISGTLQDPYTGRPIAFTKAAASKVQIDHIYPLDAAWNRGASTWSLNKRIRFANDTDLNLLAVDGPANASKGARTPGEWMPINKAFRCDYLTRYLQVSIAYGLPITHADHDSIELTAKTCS